MVMEYAGEELFNYIVTKGKGGASMLGSGAVPSLMEEIDGRGRGETVLPADDWSYRILPSASYRAPRS